MSLPSTVIAVGIDLGTTLSCVASCDDQLRPVTLVNAEGERLTPSMVLFEGDEVVVGREALRALTTESLQVAWAAKRAMGQRWYPRPLGGRRYAPQAIQAWILNKLRLDASRQVGRVTHAVITVPAYFDESRRRATQDAAYMAGLEVLDILNEPTAAALAFGYRQLQTSIETRRHVLVYDLGGGTFDVTILRIDKDGFTSLATDGDVQLGGQDWDDRLLDRLADQFSAETRVDPREDPESRVRWWRACEELKRSLSVREKGTFGADCRGTPWRRDVTRSEFESWTRDLLERTKFTVQETLRASRLRWSEIDDVLLVGGSTRMPAIQAMLRQLTGREPCQDLSPDESVAQGAALRAASLLSHSGTGSRVLPIRDVNAHSLGVAGTDSLTRAPRIAVLIPRNSALPAVSRRVFKTQKADQRSVLVHVVEGESMDPTECMTLGRIVIRDLPPDLPAQSPIEVVFRYESNGRFAVDVSAQGTGIALTHELIHDNGLSPAQLDAWRLHIAKLPPS